jgi:ferritin-like metal-binding protein YciE
LYAEGQKKSTTPELRDGIAMHIDQSQAQIERVEKALEILGSKPGRKVCEAMRGLVEEASHELEEHEKGPILDLVIVVGMDCWLRNGHCAGSGFR